LTALKIKKYSEIKSIIKTISKVIPSLIIIGKLLGTGGFAKAY
jgi:hypothetical protein